MAEEDKKGFASSLMDASVSSVPSQIDEDELRALSLIHI